jgi:hypothetical protein
MPSKRDILGAITRDGLLEIARQFGISGLTGKSKADIIDSLAAARSVGVEDVLAATVTTYSGMQKSSQ